MTSDSGKKKGNGGTSQPEWVVAGLSALLVLAAIGFILYQAIASVPAAPSFQVHVDSISASDDYYLVQFSVTNLGSTTAASLVMKGSLASDTGSVETSEITIDYVPGQGSREAGLIFTHDPRQYTLEIRPVGYDLP